MSEMKTKGTANESEVNEETDQQDDVNQWSEETNCKQDLSNVDVEIFDFENAREQKLI